MNIVSIKSVLSLKYLLAHKELSQTHTSYYNNWFSSIKTIRENSKYNGTAKKENIGW